MGIGLKEISKSFGSLNVLNNFSIDFIPGKINCVLGPSGCGKTTLLNIISGILKPDSIRLNDFTGKEISYIFQEDRLLPWKTIIQNIQFILRSKYKDDELDIITRRYIKLIDLENFSNYFPNQLSGGMKRRVSIARAFSYPSEIVLLDEPFKGIDISLKQNLMESIRLIWEIDKRTLIYVTHDIEESILMGDRIFIFTGRPAKVIKHFDMIENAGPLRSLTAGDFEVKEEIRSLIRQGYQINN